MKRHASQVQNVRAGLQARARDGGRIGFDGNEDFFRAQPLDDRNQFRFLRRAARARGVRKRGFRADINDLRALRRENFPALHRRFRRETDAFAIPGIGGQIDHAHDGGLRD